VGIHSNGHVPAANCLPRIAYCADSFNETNGVATFSRQFAAFAQRHEIPLLLVRPGATTRTFTEGSLTIVELAKSLLCVPLDMGLKFDLLISRHYKWLQEQFAAFNPDLVHITGPGDIGMLCARVAFRHVPKPPLVAAWHTNVHQYARLRAAPLLRLPPASTAAALGSKIETESFRAAARFYRTSRLILAPNAEILSKLTERTGKPGHVMPHGVDTELFVPGALKSADRLTLGYVGRLTPEKNVRFLAHLAAQLPAGIRERIRFLIAGDGSERAWLEKHLPNARFTGVLRDRDLANAYAQMDLFLFPSQTDTFGLVVLEAMSAGLPVVSFRLSGPQSAVEDGVTGYTAVTSAEFVDKVADLVRDDELRRCFSDASREKAQHFHWDVVFTAIYRAYETVLPSAMNTPSAVQKVAHA
jgi:phosphatidylinositol alpha 1,6-mannosyltransferase